METADKRKKCRECLRLAREGQEQLPAHREQCDGSPGWLLIEGAKTGDVRLMRQAYEWGANEVPKLGFDQEAFKGATGEGKKLLLELFKDLDCTWEVYTAARSGAAQELDFILTHHRNPQVVLNGAMMHAAFTDEISTLVALKDKGANNLDDAFVHAARWGRLESMQALRKWGAASFDKALLASNGPAIAEQSLRWGATSYDKAFLVSNGPAIAEQLLKWGARPDYDGRLVSAAAEFDVRTLVWAKEKGAKAFNEAFSSAKLRRKKGLLPDLAKRRQEVLALLGRWME